MKITFKQSASLLALISLSLLTACDQSSNSSSIATVNQRPISSARFEREWNKQQLSDTSLEQRQQVLDTLIHRSALADRAIALGLDQDPVVLETLEGILIGRLKETQLHPKIAEATVSDAEITAYYEQHKSESFTKSGEQAIAVLWFNTRGQAPLAARYQKRLAKVKDELTASTLPIDEGFGAFAVKNTEHTASRYKGGILATRYADQKSSRWLQTVHTIAKELQHPGDYSEICINEEGAFLVRLIERRPEQVRPLETVQQQIKQRLLREKRIRLEHDFSDNILASSEVEISTQNLANLELKQNNSSNTSSLTAFNPTSR